MNGKMLGLVTNLVIPVDGRNLAPVDRYSSWLSHCLHGFIHCFLPPRVLAIYTRDLLVSYISSPMFLLLNYLIPTILRFCGANDVVLSCPVRNAKVLSGKSVRIALDFL